MFHKINIWYWRYIENDRYWYMIERIDAYHKRVESKSAHDILLNSDYKYKKAYECWLLAKRRLASLPRLKRFKSFVSTRAINA